MTPTFRAMWRAGLVLLGCGILHACGGGGGGSEPGNTGIPGQPTLTLAPSQATADALVDGAEQRTRDLRLAGGLIASDAAAEPQAAGRRRALAAQDISADLCSAGSATLDLSAGLLERFQRDPQAQLLAGDRIAVASRNCVLKAPVELGAVSLGSFGVGATIDGSYALLLEQRSGPDYRFALTYTGFTYTPAGGAAFDPLNAVMRFGESAGQALFELDIDDVRVLAPPELSTAGNQIAVQRGQLRATVPGLTGFVDYDYTGWSFDMQTMTAAAGTVNVRGAGGSSASITASPSGYAVEIVAGGQTSRFGVAR